MRIKAIYSDKSTWEGTAAEWNTSPQTNGDVFGIINVMAFYNPPYRLHLQGCANYAIKDMGDGTVRIAVWSDYDMRGQEWTVTKDVVDPVTRSWPQVSSRFDPATPPSDFAREDIRGGAWVSDEDYEWCRKEALTWHLT